MARTLKVGIGGSAPFVNQNNDDRSDISIDIWRRNAEENNLYYEPIRQATSREGIRALNEGKIDSLVGSISITDPDQLIGQRAAVLEGTRGKELAQEKNMHVVPSQFSQKPSRKS